MTTKILLVDDHCIVRQGFRALLEAESDFRVVGEAGDFHEAMHQVERRLPDVIVLDLIMPGVNGFEVIRQVRKRWPRIRIVILSMHSQEGYVVEALRGGASAYVPKSGDGKELVHAVREVMSGRRYLCPPLSEEDIESFARRTNDGTLDLYETLTTRERETLQLVAQGRTSVETAREFGISRRTVESHRRSLMRKLGLKNHADLVRFAVRRGLLPPEL